MFIIGVITVAATIWTTSSNLKTQQELVTQGFADTRERDEINLRREKLESLAAITVDSQMIYRTQLGRNLFQYAVEDMSGNFESNKYKDVQNDLDVIYGLKLKALTLTSLYFPEMLGTVNSYFDDVISDVNLFLKNEEGKTVRTDVFKFSIGGETQVKRLEEYNNIMEMIQDEGSKLNQLAAKYSSAAN